MTKVDTPNIHRMPHDGDHPYVMVNRDVAQNKDLSFAARGMLAYILSQSDTWEINLSDLQQGCGRKKARAVLNELIDAGYIVPGSQTRVKGRFATTTPYQCYESPYTPKGQSVKGNAVNPSNSTKVKKAPCTPKRS